MPHIYGFGEIKEYSLALIQVSHGKSRFDSEYALNKSRLAYLQLIFTSLAISWCDLLIRNLISEGFVYIILQLWKIIHGNRRGWSYDKYVIFPKATEYLPQCLWCEINWGTAENGKVSHSYYFLTVIIKFRVALS